MTIPRQGPMTGHMGPTPPAPAGDDRRPEVQGAAGPSGVAAGDDEARARVSENPSEKRRGRPPVIPDSVTKGPLAALLGDGKSHRSKVNRWYAFHAQSVLFGHEEFRWVCSDESYRLSMLIELGRLGDEDVIREAARALCARQPKAREATAWLRGLRGHEPRPSAFKLTQIILRTVLSYAREHPGLAPTQVLESLRHAFDLWEQELVGMGLAVRDGGAVPEPAPTGGADEEEPESSP